MPICLFVMVSIVQLMFSTSLCVHASKIIIDYVQCCLPMTTPNRFQFISSSSFFSIYQKKMRKSENGQRRMSFKKKIVLTVNIFVSHCWVRANIFIKIIDFLAILFGIMQYVSLIRLLSNRLIDRSMILFGNRNHSYLLTVFFFGFFSAYKNIHTFIIIELCKAKHE